MNALSQNEREGLEDVFSSIHANTKRYEKLKELSSLVMGYTTSIDMKKLLKYAKRGVKEGKISHYLLNFSKKKKNLSK